MSEWKKYEGTDDQIAELRESTQSYGYVLRLIDEDREHFHKSDIILDTHKRLIKEYLICRPHPLVEMIIKQAQTGQPVWIKYQILEGRNIGLLSSFKTTEPNWNIPNAEYSFTPFDEVGS